MKRHAALIVSLATLAAVVACGDRAKTPAAVGSPKVISGGYAPKIDPANFVSRIDNPYFPLTPGTTFRLRGTVDGETEVRTVRVTDQTKTIMGVACVVVEDTGTVAGEIVERTLDWYAQDRQGNVWYFGEASADYENGKIVGTHGSWEAGVNGALPGIVMMARPAVADLYRQEYFRGEAEDQAEVLKTNGTLAVKVGTYDNVLVTREWTPLEPGSVEQKFYAPGVGLIAERFVAGGKGGVELIAIDHA